MGASEAISLLTERVCVVLVRDKVSTWDKVVSMNRDRGI